MDKNFKIKSSHITKSDLPQKGENIMEINHKHNQDPQIQQFENGKWVSIIDPDTLYFMIEIKRTLSQMGLKMSQNDIAKRLLR